MDTSTPLSVYAISIHILTSTICPKSNVGYATISIWDATVPRLGAPQTSVFDRLAPPVQDRLSAAESGHQAQPNKIAGLLGLQGRPIRQGGICLQQLKEQQKKDIIKIGTADVVIQEDNKGPMIFLRIGQHNQKGYGYHQNSRSKILHASMVPSGIDTIPKAEITAPKSKGEPGEGGEKDIQ
jgi:hypothetical protein